MRFRLAFQITVKIAATLLFWLHRQVYRQHREKFQMRESAILFGFVRHRSIKDLGRLHLVRHRCLQKASWLYNSNRGALRSIAAKTGREHLIRIQGLVAKNGLPQIRSWWPSNQDGIVDVFFEPEAA